MNRAFLFVSVLAFSLAGQAAAPSPFGTKNAIFSWSEKTDALRKSALAPTVTAGVFAQKIDHRQGASAKRFNQRYWLYKNPAATTNSPVLFYICGETACSEGDVLYMKPWADTIDASVVVIEHRFYGQSQPFAKLTAANLKYQTIALAMQDFATVVKQLRKDFDLRGPWIVSGGSYSGVLSSSLRLYYPQLFVGAWSSSGPLNVTADYQDYDRIMTSDMGPACTAQLQQVIAYAETLLKDPSRAAELADFKTQIGATALTDPRDFLFSLTDVQAAAVQYRAGTTLCQHLADADVIKGYIAFMNEFAGSFGYTPDAYNFNSALEETAGGPSSDLRVFYYQQCTELGLFQTANADRAISVRSSLIDINYMREGCERLFGKSVVDRTAKFRKSYFEPILKSRGATEIYFTNGSKDPFAGPGIAKEYGTWTNPGVYAQLIDGGFHCDDLKFSREPDDAHKAAHAQIKMLLNKWSR